MLQLSTAPRIWFPVLLLVAGVAWFTIVRVLTHSSGWWLALIISPLFAVGLLGILAAREYRDQIRNPTFPIDEPVDSFLDEDALWVRRISGTSKFWRAEIRYCRRAFGFAVIATESRGSFVLPASLLPRGDL